MGAARTTATARKVGPEQTEVWSPEANPAVAELLDHIAEQLGRDYVRLMERAAENGCPDHREK